MRVLGRNAFSLIGRREIEPGSRGSDGPDAVLVPISVSRITVARHPGLEPPPLCAAGPVFAGILAFLRRPECFDPTGSRAAAIGEDDVDEIDGVTGTELVHDAGAMHLDGPRADAELAPRLLVGQSPGNQLKHLMFARRQQFASRKPG